MLTLHRWRHLLLRFFVGTIAQAFLFLCLALPFAPDLGDAAFQSRSFLGALLSVSPLTFARGLLPAAVATLVVGFALACASRGLGIVWRILFPITFSFLVLLRLTALHPALASEWFVFQRSMTVRAVVMWLSSLEPGSFRHAVFAWAPLALFAATAAANLFRLGAWLLVQRGRFTRARRGFRMDEIDAQSRRYAIAGVTLVMSLVVSAFSSLFLWSAPRTRAPVAPAALERPHVFLFLVDGLRRQVLDANARESLDAPFLAQLASSAEMSTTLHASSPEALANFSEMMTCRLGLRTGLRGVFPSRALVRTPPRTFADEVAAQGYSTLFAADFAGAYLTQIPLPFQRAVSPELTLSMLAAGSLLRTLAPLQAVAVFPRLRRFSPALTLNPGVADARYLVSDFLGLLEAASADTKPVFATMAFSEPYASVRTDFPFLAHPSLRESGPFGAYARGVRRVDAALEGLWKELETRGWLKNSIVVVAGLRGFSFFGTDVDAMATDAAFASPLLVWTSGRASEGEGAGLEDRLARPIDLAPTLARRMGLSSFSPSECDGAPLLDVFDKPPQFTTVAAYQESSTFAALAAVQGQETSPVPFSRWIALDEGLRGRLFFRDGLESTLLQLRSRAWVTSKYRFVEWMDENGARPRLFDRENDTRGERDLLAERPRAEAAFAAAEELRGKLRGVLRGVGIPWVPLARSEQSPLVPTPGAERDDEERGVFLESTLQ